MTLRRTSRWAVGPLSFVISIAVCSYWNPVQAKTVPLRCMNNASGYRWSVEVDFDHSKVDSQPAEISTAMISWYDPSDEAYYDLDRGSGALTVRHASSVGGYFLYHSCRLG